MSEESEPRIEHIFDTEERARLHLRTVTFRGLEGDLLDQAVESAMANLQRYGIGLAPDPEEGAETTEGEPDVGREAPAVLQEPAPSPETKATSRIRETLADALGPLDEAPEGDDPW